MRQILSEVASGKEVSQRSLSRQLGIALGLTNLLLKRLIHKGWVRMIHVKPSRFAYLITPTGLAEKTRMSRDYVAQSTRYYAETRDRILENFWELSSEWPVGAPVGSKRVVFYGAGVIAEVGYVCLQSTDLTLVGVVDERREAPFFGMPVHRPASLSGGQLAGAAFDRLVVMNLETLPSIEQALKAAAVPPRAVFWLRHW